MCRESAAVFVDGGWRDERHATVSKVNKFVNGALHAFYVSALERRRFLRALTMLYIRDLDNASLFIPISCVVFLFFNAIIRH